VQLIVVGPLLARRCSRNAVMVRCNIPALPET
jgi:hypothetical protein